MNTAQAPPQQKGKGLAIASLVLGIIGLLLSWIPIVNYAAIVLGSVGLILGGIGIVLSHRTLSIVGAVLSVVTIVVSVVTFTEFVENVNEQFEQTGPAVSDGPDAPSATPQPAEELAIDETARVSSMAGAAAITVTRAEDLGGGSTGEAAQNGEHVAFTITWRNTGNQTLSLNPYNWSVTGPNGAQYDVDPFARSGTPIGARSLSPGGTHTGAIAFDVPATGTIRYVPWDTPLAIWNYDVTGSANQPTAESTQPDGQASSEHSTDPSPAPEKGATDTDGDGVPDSRDEYPGMNDAAAEAQLEPGTAENADNDPVEENTSGYKQFKHGCQQGYIPQQQCQAYGFD